MYNNAARDTAQWQSTRLMTGRSQVRSPAVVGEFSSQGLTFCALILISIPLCVTVSVTKVAIIKCPSHSTKSTSGRLQAAKHSYTLDKQNQNGLTVLSRHSVGTHQTNKPAHNLSGNAHPQSSQLVEPLWTDFSPERVKLVCAS